MVEIDSTKFLQHEVSWVKLPEMCAREAAREGLANFAKMFRKENVDPSADWPHDMK